MAGPDLTSHDWTLTSEFPQASLTFLSPLVIEKTLQKLRHCQGTDLIRVKTLDELLKVIADCNIPLLSAEKIAAALATKYPDWLTVRGRKETKAADIPGFLQGVPLGGSPFIREMGKFITTGTCLSELASVISDISSCQSIAAKSYIAGFFQASGAGKSEMVIRAAQEANAHYIAFYCNSGALPKALNKMATSVACQTFRQGATVSPVRTLNDLSDMTAIWKCGFCCYLQGVYRTLATCYSGIESGTIDHETAIAGAGTESLVCTLLHENGFDDIPQRCVDEWLSFYCQKISELHNKTKRRVVMVLEELQDLLSENRDEDLAAIQQIQTFSIATRSATNAQIYTSFRLALASVAKQLGQIGVTVAVNSTESFLREALIYSTSPLRLFPFCEPKRFFPWFEYADVDLKLREFLCKEFTELDSYSHVCGMLTGPPVVTRCFLRALWEQQSGNTPDNTDDVFHRALTLAYKSWSGCLSLAGLKPSARAALLEGFARVRKDLVVASNDPLFSVLNPARHAIARSGLVSVAKDNDNDRGSLTFKFPFPFAWRYLCGNAP
eukprot:TRINITY_DN8910_c0_g1_i1.p1 TRINITY_DN8910_c0_g1~~TRINITY_DN8910_c0_g1_i1.p1  ORF type:complete len:592 (-),score=80.65 TRINITY_DN8910_c0_g1_i1:290-1951(-)